MDEILSGKPKEEIVTTIHNHLTALAEDVRAGKIDLGKFVVTKVYYTIFYHHINRLWLIIFYLYFNFTF